MKTILIDPETQTVSEVDYSGTYTDIYTHIGASCFTCAGIGGESDDAIFVDDNGLLNDSGFVFSIADYPTPLVGKGLIMGCDAQGESIATTRTVEEVRAAVQWEGECTFG